MVMKKRKGILIVITFLLLVLICSLSKEANIQYTIAGMIFGNQNQSNIIFSKSSGFYKKEFILRLYAPTKEIYYTLDGSEPDKNSIKYEKPIVVKDASVNSNTYSTREDVTVGFF